MKNEEVLSQLAEDVSRSIDINRDYSDEQMMELIEGCVFDRCRDRYLSISEKQEVVNAIFNARRGLDVLQPLIDDDSITEIMVNGPDCIFIERSGAVDRVDIRFESAEKLYNIIQVIVSKVNRTVNESSPIVDARLKDGSRVNAVLPPVALNGPILTIRKFSENPLTIKQLVKMGSITGEAASLLEKLVRAKYNIFISGGTGSGKTTFLNALTDFIPEHERIITIEDSAELQIRKVKNVVRLETRNANTEGKGEITVRNLIRTSLRMRPDRIIVGEVRGAEALDMLQALNTGHAGSLSTGHANSGVDALSRLETMVLCGGLLPLEAIRSQIASALDIIVHLGRVRDMSRKVLQISEVAGCEKGEICLNHLFEFIEAEGSGLPGRLQPTGSRLLNTHKLKMAGISL